MTEIWHLTRHYISPVVTAFVGGYLFTWGIISLVVTGLVYLGNDFHNAETIGFLIAFPIFLTVFFWIFISQKTWLTYTTTFAGGALMTALAYGLQLLLTK